MVVKYMYHLFAWMSWIMRYRCNCGCYWTKFAPESIAEERLFSFRGRTRLAINLKPAQYDKRILRNIAGDRPIPMRTSSFRLHANTCLRRTNKCIHIFDESLRIPLSTFQNQKVMSCYFQNCVILIEFSTAVLKAAVGQSIFQFLLIGHRYHGSNDQTMHKR